MIADDEPMGRTPCAPCEPGGRADVCDFVIDYGHDAVDAGVAATAVSRALRQAADEIEVRYAGASA